LAESEAGSRDHAKSNDERSDGEAVENHVSKRVKSAENRNAEKGRDQKRREVDWLKNFGSDSKFNFLVDKARIAQKFE
jgi:hypothetical protein